MKQVFFSLQYPYLSKKIDFCQVFSYNFDIMASIKALASNYTIQLIGKILAVFFGLLTVGIMTRALGKTGYGEFTTAMTFLSIFGVIVEFGLTLTLVQMIAGDGAREKQIVRSMLGFRMTSGLFFYMLAPVIILAFAFPGDINKAVALGAIGFYFMSSAGMLIGVFQKHLKMLRFTITELINRVVLLSSVGLFAYLGLGVIAMMGAVAVTNVVWFIAVIWFAKPIVSIKPEFDLGIWKDGVSRSWPIAISTTANLIYLKGDIVILALFRDQAEVGLYGLAYKFLDVLTALPVMFMGLMLPVLGGLWMKKNYQDFKKYLQHGFDTFAIIAIPVAFGAQVIADGLAVFIGGPDFEGSGAVLKILTIATLGVFFGALYGHAIVAVNKQRIMVWGYIVTAAITIAGYFIFIPRFGMFGAAWMTLFSEILITLLTFFVVYKTAKAWPKLTTAFKAIVASLVMYLVLSIIPENHVLIDLVLGGFIYAAVLFAIGGVKLSTLKSLIPNGKV